ncbi:hypothetical protein V8G54_026373 [Vigna mungo]|uniref:Uncharacterized protein n=1 Tax=Vigna mungo TaxID=3915 RepID=A0AAQ3RPU9_VIGMU
MAGGLRLSPLGFRSRRFTSCLYQHYIWISEYSDLVVAMTRLNFEQVLKDNNVSDPSSVTTLHLTYKALSDITCLANFIKLEKLDLKLNNLTSLEGLRSCANLKWLSVVENKLESLEGIQGLTKLTVVQTCVGKTILYEYGHEEETGDSSYLENDMIATSTPKYHDSRLDTCYAGIISTESLLYEYVNQVLNAGKNKLKSIDQIASVVSLRALILNVLSKNPICKIGDALLKVKSITKLSLSHCQLQGIDTSLKSCAELSELRLAHNEIKSLPDELKFNSKLRNLDVGNNVITRWSEVKVVKLLTNLRNLNLQGNPVATVDKITRKIKKALPRLQIFNARPVDKDTENKQSGVVDGTSDFSVDQTGQNLKDSSEEKSARFHTKDKKKYDHLEGPDDLDSERKSSKKRKKTDDVSKKEDRVIDERNKGRKKDKADRKKDSLRVTVDLDMENKSTKKKVKKDEKVLDNKGFAPEENVSKVGKKVKKKRKNEEESELDIIDNAEASFAELFKINKAENQNHGDEMKAQEKVSKDVKVAGSEVTSFAKPKDAKMQNMESLSFPVADIGNGGPSTWGDEFLIADFVFNLNCYQLKKFSLSAITIYSNEKLLFYLAEKTGKAFQPAQFSLSL